VGLQKGGVSTLLLLEVSQLFGEIVSVLADIQNQVNDKYPEVEKAADKPGNLTREDDENLRALMGRRYDGAANLMRSVGPQIGDKLSKLRELLHLTGPASTNPSRRD